MVLHYDIVVLWRVIAISTKNEFGQGALMQYMLATKITYSVGSCHDDRERTLFYQFEGSNFVGPIIRCAQQVRDLQYQQHKDLTDFDMSCRLFCLKKRYLTGPDLEWEKGLLVWGSTLQGTLQAAKFVDQRHLTHEDVYEYFDPLDAIFSPEDAEERANSKEVWDQVRRRRSI
jgi:hypothetical protein